MWFVSKKRYNDLLKQKEDFERIAENAVTQNGRLLDDWDNAIKEMKSIHELNHQLVRRNDELIARIKELEAEKEGLELRVDILNTDYDALDYAHVQVCRRVEALCEERDHYEERCRYLEDELLNYQEEEQIKFYTGRRE